MSDDTTKDALIAELILYAMRILAKLWEVISKIKSGEIDPASVDVRKIRDDIAALPSLPEYDGND